VPGPEKGRDWDQEMAEVDRLLKKLPAAEPPPPPPSRQAASDPTVRRPAFSRAPSASPAWTGGEWVATWIKVLLGLLIGIGVAPGVWPYSHGCGLRLIFYLLGVTTVIAAGLWASISSWKGRLGFAHVVAQVLVVWGILLLTREVLPRVGADAAAVWLCPDIPPP
jgi:hypothetical protein